MILKIVFFELASKQAGFEAGEDLAGVEIVEDNEGEVAKVRLNQLIFIVRQLHDG